MEYDFDRIDFDDYTYNWVSYFDILGFSELVKSKNFFDVWELYSKTIARINECNSLISTFWFSDTSIFFSADNSPESFTSIESVSRSFITQLIRSKIPVRGALSFGKFFANKKYAVFFGPALIEAYKYGEKQNWIGYILTPSAISQMDNIGLPAHKRIHYTYWDIPVKSSKQPQTIHLPAYIIEETINEKNYCLTQLERMYTSLSKTKNDNNIVGKYKNTIDFLRVYDKTK